MTWADHHTQSERLAAEAELAVRQGAAAQAVDLYRLAAEAEARALAALDPTKTRTLGITAVSAVALWYKAHDYPQAERLAHTWLASDMLPPFAIEQLRELLQMIWSAHARERAGVEFTGYEVLVSVKGGEIITGGAPLDLIVRAVEAIRALLYRTAELLIGAPHRKRGAPSPEIREICRPWLFQAAPGSYQFVVRMQRPAQMNSFPENALQIEKVATMFLQIMKASAEDPEAALTEVVPDPEYRSTFLKLTQKLASTGRGFGRLEVKPASVTNASPIILFPGSRKVIDHALKKQSAPPPDASAGKVKQLRGVLRGLHLDQDWLEITIDSTSGQRSIRIYGARATVGDVVGPMVNREVIINTFVTPRGRYLLHDIQAVE
jgi:hypothetical protein